MHLRHHLVEAAFLVIFCALVVTQSFVAPVVSLANNGDFGKMIGRFGLGARSDGLDSAIAYAPTAYVFHPARYFVTDHMSSELLLMLPAIFIGWDYAPPEFDIRIMGAVHAAVLVIGFALLLPLSRGLSQWRRLIVLSSVTLVVSDVHYVSHLNSFYTDVAALLGLLFTIAVGLRLVLEDCQGRSWPIAFCVSAFVLIASKPQHAFLVVCLSPLALVVAGRFGRNRRGYMAAASLILVSIATLALTPAVERAMNLYSATFIRIPQVAQSPRGVERAWVEGRIRPSSWAVGLLGGRA